MVFLKNDTRKKIVFLGTPDVAALALEILLTAEKTAQIVLAVTQPPTRAPRGGKQVNSPVHDFALSRGIPVVHPHSAKDPEFLATLESLNIDLCVTAAYGNFLPKEFLKIPKIGTVNIHPSLLPLYRGAAPVQRTLEEGVQETGVSVLFTELAMDAGPILVQEKYSVDPNAKAPEVLKDLFIIGGKALVKILPQLLYGDLKGTIQDHSRATKANKITVEEGILDFSQTASTLHNKVRAFTPWPSTKASLFIGDEKTEVKVITTRLSVTKASQEEVWFTKDALCISCADDTVLEILELQLPGKKIIFAKDFLNSLHGKKITKSI